MQGSDQGGAGGGGGQLHHSMAATPGGKFLEKETFSLLTVSLRKLPLVNNAEHRAPGRLGLGPSHLVTKGHKRKGRKKSQVRFLGLSVFRTASWALTPSVSIILTITRGRLSSPVLQMAALNGCVQGHGTSKHGGEAFLPQRALPSLDCR